MSTAEGNGGGRRISNGGGETEAGGAFSDLFRLQTEFQTRVAEETIRYLRQLQGAMRPATPGTVLVPNRQHELASRGTAGGSLTLEVEVENRQRVHSMVSPHLTPLVSNAGVTWFPLADASTASQLLEPGTTRTVRLTIPIPSELPAGAYRGALLLQGFRETGVAVTLDVAAAKRISTREPAPRPGRPAPAPAKPKSRASRKRPAARKAGPSKAAKAAAPAESAARATKRSPSRKQSPTPKTASRKTAAKPNARKSVARKQTAAARTKPAKAARKRSAERPVSTPKRAPKATSAKKATGAKARSKKPPTGTPKSPRRKRRS